MYSSLLAFEMRFQPPPSSETVLTADDPVVGLVVLRLAAILHQRDRGGDVEGGESWPSNVPSAFWVRVAMVAMVCLLRLLGDHSPVTPKKEAGRRRHRAQRGEPPCGVDGIGGPAPYKGVIVRELILAAAAGDHPKGTLA